MVYRFSDADIRPVLRHRVLSSHASESDPVLLEELGLCRGLVRVDLALVNGLIHGFEIKSERDSLRRLMGQADLYSKVLDRITLVTAERHLDAAVNVVPDWWGILRVTASPRGCVRIATVRRGRRNPSPDPRYLVELLWHEDALRLLEEHGAARGVRGKPRRAVWDRVCEVLDVKVIAEAVRDNLKATAMQRGTPLSV